MSSFYICWTMDCESTQPGIENVGLGRNAMNGFTELLEEEGWRGTFFLIRSELEPLRDTIGRISENGHELAVHTHPNACGYKSPFLGVYDPETQHDIIQGSLEACKRLLDVQPTSFRPGYASCNDFTFRVLSDCGIRTTSASMPGRKMTVLASNWAGAPLFVHYMNPWNRFLTGGMDLVEIPITVDWETMIWGGQHPQDLRVEYTDAKNHAFSIQKVMKRQIEENLPVKVLVILTHNLFRYQDRQNFRRETMLGMIQTIREYSKALGVNPVGIPIGEVGEIYRRLVPLSAESTG